MKNLVKTLLISLTISCSAAVNDEPNSIEGVYQIKKMKVYGTDVPVKDSSPLIMVSLENPKEGLLTYTKTDKSTSTNTPSIICEFIVEGNKIKIFDKKKQSYVGEIIENQLMIFYEEKSGETSELTALKM